MSTKTPKWHELQQAQYHMFEAARYALQAMTLHGQGYTSISYEPLSREAFEKAADAFGYKLVKADAPEAPDALDTFVEKVNSMALSAIRS